MIILTGFIGTIMIFTATPNIEGRKITQYYGIVTGEAIMGANIVRGRDADGDGKRHGGSTGGLGQVARRRAGFAIAGYLSRRFQGAKVV